MRHMIVATLLLTITGGVFAGCTRGLPTERRPKQVIPDMEYQRKFKAQEKTSFFEDGRMMRIPPAGTVARGSLHDDGVLYTGKVHGEFVPTNALPVDMVSLRRGRDRFNTYCGPCHDKAGTGRGLIVTRGKLVPPPSFHEDRLRGEPDGHFFNVITHGVRTMPSYAAQISVEDRWAIVGYIRALQRSQHATLDDVPSDRQGDLQ